MISDGFVWLDRITSAEEAKMLYEKAKADGHGLFCPTFKIVKSKEVIGWTSIGQPLYPTCFSWVSTKIAKSRDSLMLMNMVENHVFLNGGRGLIMPVTKTSPFHEVMPTVGYRNAGTFDMFIKDL